MENTGNQSIEYLLEVIRALGVDTSDIFGVNASDGRVTAYKISDDTRDFALTDELYYEDFINKYIQENVIFEEKVAVERMCDLSHVINELSDKDTFHIHFKSIRNDEKHYHILKFVKVNISGESDSFLMAFASMDKSETKKKTAENDELTGVLTRQAFMRYAMATMKAHPETPYDIIIIDIDRFKLVNVMYGDRMGDNVLAFTAAAFSDFCSSDGVIGRLGADRFVCLIPHRDNLEEDGIVKLIDDIQKNAPVNITVKAGYYDNVDERIPLSTMCERALLAVRSIKDHAMLKVAPYNGPVSHKHMRKQSFEANFENAIREKSFKIWYQPKYDAKTRKIVGAEALVRWISPTGTLTSPGEFIPIFEEDGLIVRLDEYVFRTVCENLKYWYDRGAKVLPISVNISRASLHYEGTVLRYKKILEEFGLPIELVPLEITESASIKDDRIKKLAKELKEAGFVIHMDDFGTGFSSLSSINMLPIDVVKIDKSLIDYIGDEGGEELLKHSISLAHFKKYKVIAEGVETEEQYKFLKSIDCDMIQGYYFAKPMSYEDLVELFRKLLAENRI